MKTSLSGRTAIVTGAGRGIGRATAHALAGMGANVVVNDLGAALDGAGSDSAPAEAVAREIRDAGGSAVANRDSVAEWTSAGRIVLAALDAFGGVDILVNNAGLSLAKPIWELDAELFDRVCDSHIKGTFYCTRHVVEHMMKNRWGRIVNLVSRAGIIGVAGNAAYGAGKGGAFGLTNVIGRDLAPHGITVNAGNPSSTQPRMVTTAAETFRALGGEAAIRADNAGRKTALGASTNSSLRSLPGSGPTVGDSIDGAEHMLGVGLVAGPGTSRSTPATTSTRVRRRFRRRDRSVRAS